MDNIAGPRVLVRVEASLAAHVVDLLSAADVPASTAKVDPDGSVVAVLVDDEHWERASATVDLVFPGARTPDEGVGLSARLIRRSDWDRQEPLTLLDGRASFAAVTGAGEPARANRDPRDEARGDRGNDIDDYVPPPPPPLPATDAITRLAWAAAIGGPILLVLSALFSLGTKVTSLALAAFVGGFATLVARLPDRAGRDDGWDDGAVL